MPMNPEQVSGPIGRVMKKLRKHIMVEREDTEQKTVVDWARNYCRAEGIEMLHMMPNGSCFRRDNFPLWNWLLSMGFEPGLPDIYVDMPRACYHGARIEIKRKSEIDAKDGGLSPKQIERITMLNERGYYATVAYGAQDAIAVLKWYFGIQA